MVDDVVCDTESSVRLSSFISFSSFFSASMVHAAIHNYKRLTNYPYCVDCVAMMPLFKPTLTSTLSLAVFVAACSLHIQTGALALMTSASSSSSFPFHTAVPSSPLRLRMSGIDTVDVPPSTTEQEEAPDAQFDWFKAWYPLVPVEILDVEKPHKFQLLGQDVVVWNDGPVEGAGAGAGLFGPKSKRPRGAKRTKGTWRVFVDECPHRKVPLSEGRVEDDGSLLCSYHAWRFNGKGNCIAVPQVESKDELARIQSNPKTNCNAFPTKVLNGVLFVWPSSDENAVLESELTPVAHRPKDTSTERLWEGPWNFRELPYGADFFLENVVDPAHVGVSHHNVVGNRYANQSITLDTVKPLTKDGFAISSTLPGNDTQASITHFIAPSLVAIDAAVGMDGAKQTLELYVSPSRPGFSNHVGRMVIVKDKHGKMPKLLRAFTLPMPTWLNHIAASAFLNQDGLFLHHQERTMAHTGQYKSVTAPGEEPYHYSQAVYPVNSDKGVLHFRNWIRQLAGGRIPYKNNPTMPPASNDIVFDVWNGHTKYCKYCQDALRRLKKVRFASLFAAACMAVVRPTKLGVVGNLASTLGLAGIGLIVNKLIGMFYRYEFSHSHND